MPGPHTRALLSCDQLPWSMTKSVNSGLLGGPGGIEGGWSQPKRRINLLLGGTSLVVDVRTGTGVDKVRYELLARLKSGTTDGPYVGGKIPRKFSDLHRSFNEVPFPTPVGTRAQF